MNTLKTSVFFFSLLLLTNCQNQVQEDKREKSIYQYSTINALIEGCFDGTISIESLKQYGNFGIGTFNGLDGEMVFLDNQIYKVKSSGRVELPDTTEKTPFAVITKFKADTVLQLTKSMQLEELETLIANRLPSKNIYYAFKITGSFDFVKTRSVPKQNIPYPRLIEAAKKQTIFEFTNQQGTILGYHFPDFMQGVNVAGFHLHYLSSDKTKGGHLLKCKTKRIKVEIDYIYGFQMILPNTTNFKNKDLSTQKSDINTVEKDKK